ncbi:MAG: hypothetical protein ACREGI_04295, partial [Candidatus Levyibacteriota bacterium]
TREGAPAIFFLFFNKYNPNMYQKEVSKGNTPDLDRMDFGKFTLSQEQCPLEKIVDPKTEAVSYSGEKGVLYVDSGLCPVTNWQNNITVLAEIRRTDNSLAFYVVTKK